jgi:hypothetical protein
MKRKSIGKIYIGILLRTHKMCPFFWFAQHGRNLVGESP